MLDSSGLSLRLISIILPESVNNPCKTQARPLHRTIGPRGRREKTVRFSTTVFLYVVGTFAGEGDRRRPGVVFGWHRRIWRHVRRVRSTAFLCIGGTPALHGVSAGPAEAQYPRRTGASAAQGDRLHVLSLAPVRFRPFSGAPTPANTCLRGGRASGRQPSRT